MLRGKSVSRQPRRFVLRIGLHPRPTCELQTQARKHGPRQQPSLDCEGQILPPPSDTRSHCHYTDLPEAHREWWAAIDLYVPAPCISRRLANRMISRHLSRAFRACPSAMRTRASSSRRRPMSRKPKMTSESRSRPEECITPQSHSRIRVAATRGRRPNRVAVPFHWPLVADGGTMSGRAAPREEAYKQKGRQHD